MNKRGKNNKGQVTIFIIIAVLIIVLGVLFFVFKDSLNIGKTSVETEPIQTNILSCLESTSEEGINHIALYGGYYKIQEGISFSYLADEIPYYYINSKENVPSISRVERELEYYINENLKSCVNFSSFEEQGFSINEGNLSSSVNINEDKINVKINYPLTIKKGESTYRLKDFKTEIISPVEKLRAASEEIVNLYSENPGFVCLSCLEDISNKYGVEAKATPMQDKNVIWFSVSDSENKLNWRFVVKQ
jgi:hypothetical protein